MDRRSVNDKVQGLQGRDLIDYLSDIESRWGVKYGDECNMTTKNVYNTICHYFLKNEHDAQDEVTRRVEDHVFEIGVVMRRFKDNNELDDVLSNRCNRICELLFYADLVLKGVVRMKVASKTSYTALMNNEVGITRFRPMICDDLNPQQNLIIFILNKLAINNLRKCKDKVMQAVYTSDGYFTTAWKELCTIEEYIHRNITKEVHFEQWQFLTSGKDIDRRIAEYLEKHNDHEFPSVEKDRHAFAFRNGVYYVNAKDSNGKWCDQFYPYDDITKKPPGNLVACKFTDMDFIDYGCENPMDIPTPFADSLLKYQKYTDEELYWFYVFLGRCLFDVRSKDGWEVLPYWKGVAGSGKSTVMNTICKGFYESSDVAVISNNTERQFGLGSLCDAFLVIGPEIKKDFKLEQAEFQSMISGESMSIAQKYKSTKQIMWKSPMTMGGNEVPDWIDNSGSLQRRLVIFQFNEIVKNGDMTLNKKLEAEYPSYLCKAARCYIQEAKRIGNKNIWNYLPSRFQASRDAMAEGTNSLVSFLRSDRVKLGTDLYCPRKEFIMALKTHCQEHNFKPGKWCEDFYSGPFAQFQISLQEAALEWPLGSGSKKKKFFVRGVTLEQEDDLFLEQSDL